MAGDSYTVERDALIGAPPEQVYEQLVDFHQWTNWSPWEELDPDLQRTYSGAERAVGAVYEWSGNRKAGAGRMEMTKADPPAEVVVALQFLKPFKSSSDVTFTLTREGDGTRVTWAMVGPKTFMTKVMGIFKSMDSLVGPDMEKGLAKLDAHVSR
jgi:uncharacterized protein YndB with AHSA1/START domain